MKIFPSQSAGGDTGLIDTGITSRVPLATVAWTKGSSKRPRQGYSYHLVLDGRSHPVPRTPFCGNTGYSRRTRMICR